MADPSVAVARATASLRGKRTGVVFGKRGTVPMDSKSGMEDMDRFWETAKSPPPQDGAPDKQKATMALKPSNNIDKPKKRVVPRFSLPGAKEDAGADDAVPKETNKFLARVLASEDLKATWSPSDLSAVSAAPPTPHSVPQETENNEITVSPPEAARASPDEAFEDSVNFPQAQENDAAADTLTESQDHDFPDDSNPLSDNDDLMPPPPEETLEDDGVSQMHAAPITSSPGDVDFPNEIDDDHDDEGAGFTLADDPETPEEPKVETPEEPIVETPEEPKVEVKKSKKKAKKRKKPTRSTKAAVSFSSPTGYPAGNREYQVVPVSDYKEESPQEVGVRRSKRARFPPLAYWKNEQLVYEGNDEDGPLGEAMGLMPVVSGVVRAMPTPYKKRQVSSNGGAKRKASKRTPHRDTVEDGEDSPFDDRRLRKKYDFIDSDVANLWDENTDEANDMKVVALDENLAPVELPLPRTRRKGEGKIVGKAVQSFSIPNDESETYPGYIMGKLSLPPKGIKDHESVGGCAQTFTVFRCQPGSLEVAYADPHGEDGSFDPDTAQRFLLGPGDMFRVPPGNCYRIQNHSKTTESHLTWTIIRPLSRLEEYSE